MFRNSLKLNTVACLCHNLSDIKDVSSSFCRDKVSDVLLLSHPITLKKHSLVLLILLWSLTCHTLEWQLLLSKKLSKDVKCEHQGTVERHRVEKLKGQPYKGNQLAFVGFCIIYPVNSFNMLFHFCRLAHPNIFVTSWICQRSSVGILWEVCRMTCP